MKMIVLSPIHTSKFFNVKNLFINRYLQAFGIHFLLFLVYGLPLETRAQATDKPQVIVKEMKELPSMRGLSVVNDKVVWISGANGTVAKTIDGGKHWSLMKIKGFENVDFRDIEAFDAKKAVIMGIGSPAYILRTDNGGESWDNVYQDSTEGVFMDAMMFWNPKSGMIIGDPVDNKFYILRTFNGGKKWRRMEPTISPTALPNEALFAASGSNIGRWSKKEAVFVTGGGVKRLFKKDSTYIIPFEDTAQAAGPNSIAIGNKKRIIVVGGNYLTAEQKTDNCYISDNEGRNWFTPTQFPSGYRSAVIHYRKMQWFSCGLNGIDMSVDNGNTWTKISDVGFHAMQASKNGKRIYFCGKGKVGWIEMK